MISWYKSTAFRAYTQIKNINKVHFLHKSSIFTQANLRMSAKCSTFAPDLNRLMRRSIVYGFVLGLLAICPLCAWADITHDIQAKYSAGTLVSLNYTHARSTNDAIEYTFSGSADMLYDYEHRSGSGGKICLNLMASGASITTSPSLNKLNGLTITHIPNSQLSSSKVLVEVSLDGSAWSSPTVTYGVGTITVVAPENSYYVRIRSVSTTKVSIERIVYSIGECACFPYVPE